MSVNPEDIAEVAAALQPLHIRALGELDDFVGRGPAHLSAAMGIPVAEARSILQHFRREGVCAYGPLVEEDSGLMMGRGYWLDHFGRAVRDAVTEKM